VVLSPLWVFISLISFIAPGWFVMWWGFIPLFSLFAPGWLCYVVRFHLPLLFLCPLVDYVMWYSFVALVSFFAPGLLCNVVRFHPSLLFLCPWLIMLCGEVSSPTSLSLSLVVYLMWWGFVSLFSFFTPGWLCYVVRFHLPILFLCPLVDHVMWSSFIPLVSFFAPGLLCYVVRFRPLFVFFAPG
jgi:hypothetical protein